MKKFLAALLLPFLVATPAAALSDAQKGAISGYCDSIRNTLKTIQREDSRTRISIGAVYESLASRFITPLNLRLVATNHPNTDLIDLQSTFIATRADFSARFIDYSRFLEELIATDCTADPDSFYQKLTVTHALRAEVNDTANTLKAAAFSFPELTL